MHPLLSGQHRLACARMCKRLPLQPHTHRHTHTRVHLRQDEWAAPDDDFWQYVPPEPAAEVKEEVVGDAHVAEERRLYACLYTTHQESIWVSR